MCGETLNRLQFQNPSTSVVNMEDGRPLKVALKAASHDSQMLVTATYSQQMTEVISSTSSFDQLNWRRRMLHFCRWKPSAQISQDTVS